MRLPFGMSSTALKVGLAVLAVASVATAAITITYSNSSTLTTSVTPPPVQFIAGGDAGASNYVTAYSVSTNKTWFSSTVKGIPEGTVVVGSFVQITNIDTAAHTATVSTGQVSNAFVSAYTVQFYNAANALQGTLTLTAGSPSVSLTIPAGETWYGKLTLTLATGAGADNVALSNTLTMGVA